MATNCMIGHVTKLRSGRTYFPPPSIKGTDGLVAPPEGSVEEEVIRNTKSQTDLTVDTAAEPETTTVEHPTDAAEGPAQALERTKRSLPSDEVRDMLAYTKYATDPPPLPETSPKK